MSDGFVVDAEEVPEHRAPGDTAAVRETIGAAAGSPTLRQQVVTFAPGRSLPREPGDADEVVFVLRGQGSLVVGGEAHPLEPETGAYLRPGERYEVENPGPDELEVVSVLVAEPDEPADDGARAVTVHPAERQPATTDRAFRIVCDPGTGCGSVTQFVGEIPPARAPVHFHRYDEVIYVLEGDGTIDIGDELHARLARGTCIHLPARRLHCLHNTTGDAMRVLGVFRPAGSPAAAYYPDGTPAYGGGEDT
jgi:quercetin dioxygenase-like cupin family protein